MKTTTNSRRTFLSSVALGAAAGGLSLLPNSLHAATSKFSSKEMNEAEKWLEGIKGTQRVIYDGSTPHQGFPIVWNWAFYLTNNQTGVPDEDITAITVLRHSAIGFALDSSVWKKYKLGEFFELNDNSTGKPLLRNPMYEPKEGDMPLPPIQGIKDLQARGAMFCVCDLALNVYSGFVAQAQGHDPATVYQDFKNAVLPGVQVVPSGVWALGRAQQHHNCAYIFAGN